jgi:hypothetical protein
MTRAARGAFLPLACAVALAGLPLGTAQAQTFDPQPYLVYDAPATPLDPNPVMDLEGQFGLREDVAVREAVYFMNPVQMEPIEPPGEMEEMTDASLHYRWFDLDSDFHYGPVVLVTDQFGTCLWILERDASYLLAPTSKSIGTGEPGTPPNGQHYACYVYVGGTGCNPAQTVSLTDQFGSHGPYEVFVGYTLCVPVEKTHDQQVYDTIPAADGRDLLTCYNVPWDHNDTDISTRNQFTGAAPDEIDTSHDYFLCVPASQWHPSAVPSLRSAGIVALGLLMLLMVFWVGGHRVRPGAPT